MFNPEHKKVDCRGVNGALVQDCAIWTRAGSGLCANCRNRIMALQVDLELAKELQGVEL